MGQVGHNMYTISYILHTGIQLENTRDVTTSVATLYSMLYLIFVGDKIYHIQHPILMNSGYILRHSSCMNPLQDGLISTKTLPHTFPIEYWENFRII